MFAVIRTRTQVVDTPPFRARARRLAFLVAMAAAVVLPVQLGIPITARAESLVVEVVPVSTTVSVPPGYSGTLELDLLNPSTNTQSFDVAGFQFELQIPVASGVLFSDATTSTTAEPYIFAGNSVADLYFGGSLIVSPPPPPATSDLQGFDTVANPGTYTTLSPGASFGLGLISFSVDAGATPGSVPVSIIPFSNTDANGTQISDNNGNAIGFTSSDGVIVIQAAGTVPEPSSLMLVIVGGCGSILLSLMHRWRHPRVITSNG